MLTLPPSLSIFLSMSFPRPSSRLSSICALVWSLHASGCTDWEIVGPVEADGDGDADGDSDIDGDNDIDGGADGGDRCGLIDRPCCEDGTPCGYGLLCTSFDNGPEICHQLCTPAVCSYGAETGYCYDLQADGIGVCFPPARYPDPSTCEIGELRCMTDYGVNSETICLFEAGVNYCMELCIPGQTGCPEGRICVPLASGGGFICNPIEPSP